MHRSKISLWIGWGLACVFLGTTAFLGWQLSRPIAAPTDENLRMVKEGMTLQQLEQLLGPGRPIHGPFPSIQGKEVPKSAVWKLWIHLRTRKAGWEDVSFFAFVDGRVAQMWGTSRPIIPEPINPEPVFVAEDVSRDKLLQPQMSDARKIFHYRGGYVDCWVEVATDGKKEVVGKVSHEQLRMKGQEMTAEMESEVYGQIFWDIRSLGPQELTLLVTATGRKGPGRAVETITAAQRGLNDLIKEKWPDLWNGKSLGEFQGPANSYPKHGEETLLSAWKLTGGEIRLMCKIVGQGKKVSD